MDRINKNQTIYKEEVIISVVKEDDQGYVYAVTPSEYEFYRYLGLNTLGIVIE